MLVVLRAKIPTRERKKTALHPYLLPLYYLCTPASWRCQRSTRHSTAYLCSEAPPLCASRRAATKRKSERRLRKTPMTS